MYSITHQHRLNSLIWLSLFHVLVITSSNYLVQFPITVFNVSTTWGAFTFPFIFLATDLTVRIFGAPLARRIILLVMMPALLISYALSTLFFDAQWQGWQALSSFNISVARIALASFGAYLLGQLLDIQVFNRLRQLKTWWIAPAASMIFGNMSDTLSFFSIAFYRSNDAFMSEHWLSIAWVDYLTKLTICILFFLPTYGVILSMIMKRITQSSLTPMKQLA